MNDYMVGSDVLSAGPFVTIHVTDVAKLLAAQGGALGSALQGAIPKTAEALVYGKLRDTIAAGLKEKGVDADVQVVSGAMRDSPLRTEFVPGVVLGAGAVSLAWFLKALFSRS
jgi:hypothetical protein